MGTNAFLPSGEATTSCPVTPPSTMVATCRPLSGSTRPRVWSLLLATSSRPADEDEGGAESGVKNPAKMNVIARNQVMVIPLGLSRAILSHFGLAQFQLTCSAGYSVQRQASAAPLVFLAGAAGTRIVPPNLESIAPSLSPMDASIGFSLPPEVPVGSQQPGCHVRNDVL